MKLEPACRKGVLVFLFDESSKQALSSSGSKYAEKVSSAVERLLAYHAKCPSCDLLWGYRFFDSTRSCMSFSRQSIPLQPVSFESSQTLRTALFNKWSDGNSSSDTVSTKERCGAISRTLEDALRDAQWANNDDTVSMDSFMDDIQPSESREKTACSAGHQVPSRLYLFCDSPESPSTQSDSMGRPGQTKGKSGMRWEEKGVMQRTADTSSFVHIRRSLESMKKRQIQLMWVDTAPVCAGKVDAMQVPTSTFRTWMSTFQNSALLVYLDSLLLDRCLVPFNAVMSNLERQARRGGQLTEDSCGRADVKWRTVDIVYKESKQGEAGGETESSFHQLFQAQMSMFPEEQEKHTHPYEVANKHTAVGTAKVFILKGYLKNSILDEDLFRLKGFENRPQLLRPGGKCDDQSSCRVDHETSRFAGFLTNLAKRQALAIIETHGFCSRNKSAQIMLIQPITPILAAVRDITLLNHIPELEATDFSSADILPTRSHQLSDDQQNGRAGCQENELKVPHEYFQRVISTNISAPSFSWAVQRELKVQGPSEPSTNSKTANATETVSLLMDGMLSHQSNRDASDPVIKLAGLEVDFGKPLSRQEKMKLGDELFTGIQPEPEEEPCPTPLSISNPRRRTQAKRKRILAFPTRKGFSSAVTQRNASRSLEPVLSQDPYAPLPEKQDIQRLNQLSANRIASKRLPDDYVHHVPVGEDLQDGKVLEKQSGGEQQEKARIAKEEETNLFHKKVTSVLLRFAKSKEKLSSVSAQDMHAQIRECLQDLKDCAECLSSAVKADVDVPSLIKTELKKSGATCKALSQAQKGNQAEQSQEDSLSSIWNTVLEGYQQVLLHFVDNLRGRKPPGQTKKRKSMKKVKTILSNIHLVGEFCGALSTSRRVFQDIFFSFLSDVLLQFVTGDQDSSLSNDVKDIFEDYDLNFSSALQRKLQGLKKRELSGQERQQPTTCDAMESNIAASKSNHSIVQNRNRRSQHNSMGGIKKKNPLQVLATAKRKRNEANQSSSVRLAGKGVGISKDFGTHVALAIKKKKRKSAADRSQLQRVKSTEANAVKAAPVIARKSSMVVHASTYKDDPPLQNAKSPEREKKHDIVVPATPTRARRLRSSQCELETPTPADAMKNSFPRDQRAEEPDSIQLSEVPESPDNVSSPNIRIPDYANKSSAADELANASPVREESFLDLYAQPPHSNERDEQRNEKSHELRQLGVTLETAYPNPFQVLSPCSPEHSSEDQSTANRQSPSTSPKQQTPPSPQEKRVTSSQDVATSSEKAHTAKARKAKHPVTSPENSSRKRPRSASRQEDTVPGKNAMGIASRTRSKIESPDKLSQPESPENESKQTSPSPSKRAKQTPRRKLPCTESSEPRRSLRQSTRNQINYKE